MDEIENLLSSIAMRMLGNLTHYPNGNTRDAIKEIANSILTEVKNERSRRGV